MCRLITILILITTTLFTSCSKTDDSDSYYSQCDRIESYLDGLYETYSTKNGVYYVSLDSEQPSDRVRLEVGDSASIYYYIYTFYSSPDSLLYTNIEDIATESGYQTSLFNFTPLKIKYGTTPLFEGFNLGLEGMGAQDSSIMLIPSDLAYGDNINGMADKNTTIMVFATITDITKQE